MIVQSKRLENDLPDHDTAITFPGCDELAAIMRQAHPHNWAGMGDQAQGGGGVPTQGPGHHPHDLMRCAVGYVERI